MSSLPPLSSSELDDRSREHVDEAVRQLLMEDSLCGGLNVLEVEGIAKIAHRMFPVANIKGMD